MSYLLGFVCVCALGFLPLVGCGENNGGGGSGGTAGTGGTSGTGGTGGMPECQGPEDCDDGDECTVDRCIDGVCSHVPAEDGAFCADDSGRCIAGSCRLVSCEDIENGVACFYCGLGAGGTCDFGFCLDGVCMKPECEIDADCTDHNDCTAELCMAPGLCTDPVAVQDGTSCAGGMCQDGACALESSVLPCTEQGIRNAVVAGGGPYTFDCQGPTTLITDLEIAIDNDVILDGEGNLTVDGDDDHLVFNVTKGTVELSGFKITGGASPYGSAIVNEGTLKLTNSAIYGTIGVLSTAIVNLGDTLTLSDCSVSGNEGGGIENMGGGTLTVTNSVISGNAGGYGAIFNPGGTLTIINSTVSIRVSC